MERLPWLNELELLRACNAISQADGGCLVGSVGEVSYDPRSGETWVGRSWPRQYLISVELEDDGRGLFGGAVEFPRWKIRMGFCQSQIGRAWRGGFPLYIEHDVLALCRRVDDVFDVWRVMRSSNREMDWHFQVKRWREREETVLPLMWNMTALIHRDALAYAEENRVLR